MGKGISNQPIFPLMKKKLKSKASSHDSDQMEDTIPIRPPTPIPSSLSLVPRLNLLDSVMRNLHSADKKSAARWGKGSSSTGGSVSSIEKRRVPVDMALREAQLRGSLLDRVKSLENRLLQLCLELESKGTPLPNSSFLRGLKESSCSKNKSIEMGFGSANYPSPPIFVPSNTILGSESQTRPLLTSTEEVNDKVKETKGHKTKKEKTRKAKKKEVATTRKEKVAMDRIEKKQMEKSKKKKSSFAPAWLHFRLLGC